MQSLLDTLAATQLHWPRYLHHLSSNYHQSHPPFLRCSPLFSPDRTNPIQTRPYRTNTKSKPDQIRTRPNQTRSERTKPDQTAPDQTKRDQTEPDHVNSPQTHTNTPTKPPDATNPTQETQENPKVLEIIPVPGQSSLEMASLRSKGRPADAAYFEKERRCSWSANSEARSRCLRRGELAAASSE
jgi:hypothetical protein